MPQIRSLVDTVHYEGFHFLSYLLTKWLNVPTFIYHHLQENPEWQRFAIKSGILAGNDSKWLAVAVTFQAIVEVPAKSITLRYTTIFD